MWHQSGPEAKSPFLRLGEVLLEMGLQGREPALLKVPTSTLRRHVCILGRSGAAQLDEPMPARRDSAWSVYASLPDWAKEAASQAYSDGGTVLVKRLTDLGLSNREIKQMIHGPHDLFSAYGTALKLNELGRKVAVIHSGKPKQELQK